jgi:hypothetical protein
MQRKKPGVDIIKDVLEASLLAYPASTFIQSLSLQYEERGFLSKKQLHGLHQKALKVKDMPQSKLGTLEAIILKMPTRFKSALPENEPLFVKDVVVGEKINGILAKYPQHKRVLFFQSKYENNEILNSVEMAELERFAKLLAR